MVNNFELLMGFTSLRDFAICASKNNLCCHKTRCDGMLVDEKAQERSCRLCWLDFLTDNKGLNLSYLDKDETIERKKQVQLDYLKNL